MVDVAVIPAAAEHIDTIAERMRGADVAEVQAASGFSPAQALAFSLDRSDAWTAIVDGRPEVMFGVGPISILTSTGAPWLLGTDAIERHTVTFLRASLAWRGQLLRRYAVLKNFVDDRNALSKRWLRWLGFHLSEPFIAGVEQRPFRLFELRAEDVQHWASTGARLIGDRRRRPDPAGQSSG